MSVRYWLGGSPCAGKSTVAERLCAAHGLGAYKADDHFGRHLEVAAARGWPVSTWLRTATATQIFCRSHAENVALALAVFREHFPLVVEDLAAIDEPLLVEGNVLLPDALAAHGVAPARAFYLVPTEAFQRAHYARRAWARDRVKDTPDPDAAFESWMARDVDFARAVAADAERHGYPARWVDGTRSPEETTLEPARAFALTPTEAR